MFVVVVVAVAVAPSLHPKVLFRCAKEVLPDATEKERLGQKF